MTTTHDGFAATRRLILKGAGVIALSACVAVAADSPGRLDAPRCVDVASKVGLDFAGDVAGLRHHERRRGPGLLPGPPRRRQR